MFKSQKTICEKKDRKKGFTILETLVAVAILALAITGPLELAFKGISYTKLSQNQIIASYLAQEGMELIRNIRDSNKINHDPNWLNNLSNCISPNLCYVDAQASSLSPVVCMGNCPIIKYSDSNGYNYSSVNPTIFTRNISIDNLVNNIEARVRVSVVWEERIGQRRVELEETIYNIP
ncbi:prepilin-type N-terminal cleavage/methylation domain-containing protein [Patescibacteria group bacterium]|nr:prepilin-type N-terminal cleavage/methylation domain-containing protein [Patescibacteria group bacterium]